MLEFGSGFDLANGMARGRPLVARYMTGARVEYESLRRENFVSSNWTDPLEKRECSGKMEHNILYTELNKMFMEHPLQVTYTTAMFFLFHNAQFVRCDRLIDSPEFLTRSGTPWCGWCRTGSSRLASGLYHWCIPS